MLCCLCLLQLWALQGPSQRAGRHLLRLLQQLLVNQGMMQQPGAMMQQVGMPRPMPQVGWPDALQPPCSCSA
jgi:hypothetical protein